MKFAERVLILLAFIGWYLAVLKRPADLSVVFVAAAGLAVLYVLFMYPLLQKMSLKRLFARANRSTIKTVEVVVSLLFGVLNAYCVFAIIYQQLKQMTSLALVENCGVFLALFAGLAYWYYRRSHEAFYKRILWRTGIWAVLITVAVLFRP